MRERRERSNGALCDLSREVEAEYRDSLRGECAWSGGCFREIFHVFFEFFLCAAELLRSPSVDAADRSREDVLVSVSRVCVFVEDIEERREVDIAHLETVHEGRDDSG